MQISNIFKISQKIKHRFVFNILDRQNEDVVKKFKEEIVNKTFKLKNKNFSFSLILPYLTLNSNILNLRLLSKSHN